ncbi:uncharacterized protein LOC115219519 [Argonauta hians]
MAQRIPCVKLFSLLLLFLCGSLGYKTPDNDALSCCYETFASTSLEYLEKAFFLNKQTELPGLQKYFFNLAQEKNYAADLIARFMNELDWPIRTRCHFKDTNITKSNHHTKTAYDYLSTVSSLETKLLKLLRDYVTSTELNNDHVKHFITHWLLDYQYKRYYEVEIQKNKFYEIKDKFSDEWIYDRHLIKQSRIIYDYDKFQGFTANSK